MHKKPSLSAKPFSYFLECCLPALRFLCFLLVMIAVAWFGVTSLRPPPVENELAFGGFWQILHELFCEVLDEQHS